MGKAGYLMQQHQIKSGLNPRQSWLIKLSKIEVMGFISLDIIQLSNYLKKTLPRLLKSD